MRSFIDPAMSGSPSTSSPVSSNIQHYLAQSTLPRLRLAQGTPPLPSGNHKTHRNSLAIRPERYRRLRFIHRIKWEYLDVRCLDFIQKHIPSTPVLVDDLDPDAFEQPSIPCGGFDVEVFGAPPVRHIDAFCVSWFENSVLRTVHGVLRLIPEYREIVKNYSFTGNDIMRDEDHHIFRYFMWERSGESSSVSDSPVKFILAYQPPWILGPRDIDLFTDKRLRKLPSFEVCEESGQHRYTSTQRLWAKLWDVCKMHNCHSFVLTNYNQWVFGGFSKGWENGFTMGVKQAYPPDVKGIPKLNPKGKQALPRIPTMLEYLVYWTVSSMHLPDQFVIPPVCDEVPYFPRELPCRMYDIRMKCSIACAAYFQVPEETELEMAIDDSIDVLFFQPLGFVHTNVQSPTSETIEPSETDFNSKSSDILSSAGVRFGPESDSGMTPPRYLDNNWKPLADNRAAERDATIVERWYIRNAESGPPSPMPTPTIPRSPSPVRSEWSEKSMATRKPRIHQGFHNISTVIVEEVCEYDFTRMDIS